MSVLIASFVNMPSPDDVSQRLLPYDVDFGQARTIGSEASASRPPNPPSFADLAEAGLFAPEGDPDRSFNTNEKSFADWMRNRGLKVLSIQRRVGIYERTPDAALIDHEVTVELKRTTASLTAIVKGIRMGRGQSRRVAIDVRGQACDAALALTAIARAVRFYGEHLEEIIVVVEDGQSVGWWRGRDTGSE